MGRLARLVAELKRRKVVATAGVYLVGAFVTMQVVEAVFPYLPDEVFGYLPVSDEEAAGELVLVLLLIGFPVALVLSWVLQFTPPGFRRELTREEAEEDPGGARGRARTMRTDSVAVLPFQNYSADPEDAYFSDGITDDIIASVAHVPGIRVLSRSSVMQFRESVRTTQEIASALGVATLVTGSVRRSGSQVRIVATVVDGRTDDHLWTETYDRGLQDIFQVQSEVAARVGEAVQRELSAADKKRIAGRGTSDPEAYDLYLRARFLWNQRSEASLAESVRFFERALERDARFALAHAGLADAHTILGVYGLRAPGDVFEKARGAAGAALEVDPRLGEAMTTRACVHAVFDWDWAAAERDFREALELAPSYATAHQWYATILLTPLGRFDDAKRQLGEACELDPSSSAITTSHGLVAFYERDLERARAELERSASLHPRFALAHSFLGQCRALAGDSAGAIEALRLAVQLADESSETLAALAHALAIAGETEEAEEAESLLQRLDDRSSRAYVSPALQAQVLIGLGRHDEALDRLEAAADERAADLIWTGVRPVYDPLRGSPRFEAIVGEVGVGEVNVGG